MTLVEPRVFFTEATRAGFEARWNAEAETLFREYTAAWTEEQRAFFRARIFPEPIRPPKPRSTAEQIAATKMHCEAHPAWREERD
jgi:hypothetical protein